MELVLRWFVMRRGGEVGERVGLVEGRVGEEVEGVAAEEVEEPEVRLQGGADVPVQIDSWEEPGEEGRGPMSGLVELVLTEREGVRAAAARGPDVHSHGQLPILRWCDLWGFHLETLRSTLMRCVSSSHASRLAGSPLELGRPFRLAKRQNRFLPRLHASSTHSVLALVQAGQNVQLIMALEGGWLEVARRAEPRFEFGREGEVEHSAVSAQLQLLLPER